MSRLLPTTTDMVFYVDASHALQYVDSYIWPDLSGNNNNVTLFNSPSYSSENKGKFSFNVFKHFTHISAVLNFKITSFLFKHISLIQPIGVICLCFIKFLKFL